jgi:phosphate transport system permease protein
MSLVNLIIALALLIAVAYFWAHSRSLALAKPLGGIRHLHSLPLYYGLRGAVWCGLPALVVLCLWLMFDDPVVQSLVLAGLPADAVPAGPAERSLLLSTVVNVASGALPVADQPAAVAAAAERYNALRGTGQLLVAVITLGVAISGLLWGVRRMSPQLRARQEVERVFRWAREGGAPHCLFFPPGDGGWGGFF